MISSREKLYYWAFFTLVGLTVVTAAAALAASTGSLNLAGFVAQRFSVSITTPAAKSSGRALALSPAFDDYVELANIVEINNGASGFIVTIASHNHGRLEGSGQPGPRYELSYNSEKIDLSAGPTTVSSGFRAAGTTTTHTLKIRFNSENGTASPAQVTSDAYTDTLTFSVAAI